MDFDLENGMRELADDTAREARLPVEELGRRLRARRAARAATVAVVAVAASGGLVVGAAALLDRVERTDVVAPSPTAEATRAPTVTPTPTSTPAPSPSPPPVEDPVVTPDPSVPPEPSAPALPRPSDEVQGSTAWAVYVAVTPTYDDPALAEADARLTALGYTRLRGGSLACDRGAAEALGRDPDEAAMAMYFDTQEDAARFVELYGDGVVGTVQVTMYCRD
ncbi:hypothetical protein [Cellulomonas phragmiteti]|uniref:LytR/CpsA/Psr regulator C-terminal domain-containing protein n=1 Tax=Cellulomonas phragmiteti TaxID=478780 RepID=A0ABQ4DMK5_9CELL|nr:hypothetical protein [Cellulomonas phragmiteti]GIG40570.1 hypothetical protein Cph01nite_23320 [Cellulomonas phragmiteti]